MGRAGRPKGGVQQAGSLGRVSAGGPAEQAMQEGGLSPEDYPAKIQEVDDTHYRWSVEGRYRGHSGFAESETRARQEAAVVAAQEAENYKETIMEREAVFQERRDMLEGLQLPDKIGAMETDIKSDPRIEDLKRKDLGDGYSMLSYRIDRKHKRSPYPVIASEGRPEKEAGYLLFFEGNLLRAGNNGRPEVSQPSRLGQSLWRKKMQEQAEQDIDVRKAMENGRKHSLKLSYEETTGIREPE